MTDATAEAVPATKPEENPEKPKLPPFEFGVSRHWTPTETYLMSQELCPDTSYAAGLVLIHALPGIAPEILLVRQNQDDAEAFLQLDGSAPRKRPDSWKSPIGRFTRDRYLDQNKKGILDNSVWDTFIEECWREELGIDMAHVGKDEEENARIWESLKQSPVVEHKIKSKRGGSVYHVDRIHFFITPQRFEPDPNVWKRQVELKDVRYFPLAELPNWLGMEEKNLNGEGATMLYSHVRRLVEFFECPQADVIKWQAGIPDNISETIRNRFPSYTIPR